MKAITVGIILLISYSLGSGKEETFVGSTPAGSLVKAFMGIALADSVDYIRWRLVTPMHIRDHEPLKRESSS
jgi:hypothetical protein